MKRKYSSDIDLSKHSAFYCWECVSVKTEERTLDLLFRDRNKLLTFINGMKCIVSES